MWAWARARVSPVTSASVQSLPGESGGLFRFVLAVGEQAPVGVEPRELGFAPRLRELVQGGFVMKAGEVPFPQAGVDVPYFVLDLGQVLRPCGGGRGLVAGQRRAVLARAGPEIPYGPVQRGGVGMPERERLLVMAEGLAVGVQAARVVSGQQVVACSLDVLPGEPVVAGYLAGEGVCLASAGPTGERRGGAAVQEALAGQAGLFVDQRTELVVVEVVGWGYSRGADLPDEAA